MATRKQPKRPLRLEWIEAGSLADNPANWRRHPEGQTAALKAMLDDVGWAGALLYNEQTKRLIDGHARKDAVPPGTIVPVLVGRWDEDAERRILATLDPLAAMATPDGDALEILLAEVDLPEDLEAVMDAMLSGGRGDDGGKPGSTAGGKIEPDTDELTALEQKYLSRPPSYTWTLIGIPTNAYYQVTETVEALAAVEGAVVKVSVTDD